jgi:hypothetical protein
MKRDAARTALARLIPALLFGLTGAGGQEAARLSLWDTGSIAEGGEVDFGSRKNWEPVAPGTKDRALSGDVVVENERMVVVFCRRGAGPVISPNPVPRDPRDRARIVAVAPGGEAATRLGAIEIRKNDKSEIVLEVASLTPAGKEIRTACSLGRGRSFLETKPLRDADRVRIEAPTRFAVIPDFFGADMVFDPRAYPQARLVIPPENFVLDLLEGGNTLVMAVWPTGHQEARLALEGAGEDRRIAATEITLDSKSLYAGMLHAPGLWHEFRLRKPYVDKDLPMGWKRPFPAKWRANFCSGRRSDSWDFQDRRTETWMYLYQAIVWPCWFEGEDGFVRLSKKFIGVKGPMESVLVYPLERKRETPLAVFTPVDLMRDTLGVGPCEYVLDREGLQGRSSNSGRKSFGRGVCDTTTPIEYLFITGIEARESALIGHLLDDILADNVAINARVLEFRRFGQELGRSCAAMRQEAASASTLLDEAEKTAKAIEAIYQEKLPTIHDPPHAARLAQRLRELASMSDPENLGECKTLTYELRDIAGTQHYMVGDYRVMVKRLRQEAAIQGSEDPATAKIAESIRKLSAQVLRKKYGVEAD